jgi:hypothetical protein
MLQEGKALANIQRCVRADERPYTVNQRRRGSHNGFSPLFNYVSLLPKSGISHLCEDLNSIVGHGRWYDEYEVRNTQWLQLVSDIVEAMNSDTALCGYFGLFPSYTAGILNSVKSINSM